jgi:hypothetical protein
MDLKNISFNQPTPSRAEQTVDPVVRDIIAMITKGQSVSEQDSIMHDVLSGMASIRKVEIEELSMAIKKANEDLEALHRSLSNYMQQ